jgi:hypothetical protein
LRALGLSDYCAYDGMDYVPASILESIFIFQFFFQEETCLKSLGLRVCHIHTCQGVVIVHLRVHFKDLICSLLKFQQPLRWEECCVAGRKELIAPRGAIAIAVSVELVLQVCSLQLGILRNQQRLLYVVLNGLTVFFVCDLCAD